MAERALDFRVVGKVQGVWFRKHTKVEADRLGLAGHVKNMPDDSVTGFAQGPTAAIAEMCGRFFLMITRF